LIEHLVAEHGGHVVKPRGEGDSRFAVFVRPSDAVAAACAIQVALAEEHWNLDEPLRARIAVHTGEADLRQGDYYAPAVNHCARLRAIAHGGQVLVSTLTADLIRESLSADVSLLNLGVHQLKDLDQPERVWQLVHPELRAEFPPLTSLASKKDNLPGQISSFVGRDSELAQLQQLLSGNRMVTLTGVGGVGKTRLALQAAADLVHDFRDGVWLVELAALADPELVPPTVCAVLHVKPQSCELPSATLTRALQFRKLLLVLDNCEHIVQGCAELTGALLRTCPELSILATSREPLGCVGERVWRVRPLSLPDPGEVVSPERVLASDAGRLFAERAGAARVGFAVTTHNAGAVDTLCRELEGLPLAIELAAARVGALGVKQITERLADQLNLLAGAAGGQPARHQTLRAAIDWSYALLSEPERVLFERLSVFAGGCSLEAAEVVCSGAAVEHARAFEILARLVNRSLVLADEEDGRMRYRLLEPVRQYAAEQLARAGEVIMLRDRHLEWCVALAERGEREIWLADQVDWMIRLEREADNLRAALSWSLVAAANVAAGLRIAASMMHFWDLGGHLFEGVRWLNSLLAAPGVPPHTPAWARANTALGYLTALKGDIPGGLRRLDESIGFWRTVGDHRRLAVALLLRGGAIFWANGDVAQVEPTLAECLALSTQWGPEFATYWCLFIIGEAVRAQGDLERAEHLITESLTLSRAVGERSCGYFALLSLALLALSRNDAGSALAMARSSLQLSLELGDVRGSTYALEAVACAHAAQGQSSLAARLFGAAQALREPVGNVIPATLAVDRDRVIAQVRAQLGEDRWAAELGTGRALAFAEAVESATDEPIEASHRGKALAP
jgi:predicted ATPase